MPHSTVADLKRRIERTNLHGQSVRIFGLLCHTILLPERQKGTCCATDASNDLYRSPGQLTANGSRLSLRQPANESTPETCCQRSSGCATYACPLLPENTAVFQLTHVPSSCLFLPALKDEFLQRLQLRAAQQDLELVTNREHGGAGTGKGYRSR